jgi:hypothetical protein
MRRLVVPILAAIALAGCAGAYVAGDVGPNHGDLSRDHVASRSDQGGRQPSSEAIVATNR